MKFPCKDCEKRVLGCHSNCEEYLAAKKNNINKENTEIFDYFRNRNAKLEKYRRQHSISRRK